MTNDSAWIHQSMQFCHPHRHVWLLFPVHPLPTAAWNHLEEAYHTDADGPVPHSHLSWILRLHVPWLLYIQPPLWIFHAGTISNFYYIPRILIERALDINQQRKRRRNPIEVQNMTPAPLSALTVPWWVAGDPLYISRSPSPSTFPPPTSLYLLCIIYTTTCITCFFPFSATCHMHVFILICQTLGLRQMCQC